MRTRWLALGVAVLLVGCGSSPKTQYYTLDDLASRSTAPLPAAMTPVQVAAVHIPPALDREEMVRETAPHRLDVSDQNRWGGPLGDMVQRVLTQDLAQRLPPNAVILPQEPAPSHHDTIVLDILQFDEDASGNVVFDGSWSLADASSDKPLLSRHLHLSERAASPSYGDQVAAMSRTLGELADNIAEAIPMAERVGGRPAVSHPL